MTIGLRELYTFPPNLTDVSSNVVLHCSCNSAVDSSPWPKPITQVGGTFDTSVKKFGTASFRNDNLTSQYLNFNAQDNTFFWFNNQDFLITFWHRPSTVAEGSYQIMGVWSNGDYGWRITKGGANLQLASRNISNVDSVDFNFDLPWVLNQWENCTISRKDGVLRVWIGSTLRYEAPHTKVFRRPTNQEGLELGRNGDNAWPMNGYLDEVLILNGVGVTDWVEPTAAFTYPLLLPYV